jgi:formate dehydrogenase major subunit
VAGPANPNGRLCPKGIDAVDVTSTERLTRPTVRRDGEHRAVPWDTAYDHVAERFAAVVDAHGPDALAFLGAPHSTTEANYLLQKIARLLGTNNVDTRPRLCHVSTARTLAGRLGWPATTNGLDDLTDADVIVVAGANPAERQPVAFNGFVRPAVDAGATLVHVDPVGNRTTRLAEVHLTPRPGTDALVFDLLSAALLARGEGVDRSFVEERTRGFDRFRASIESRSVAELASVAGVDEDTVARVADHVGTADRVAALVGTGIEGGPAETDAPAALVDLLLLTGNVGRPGTGLFVLRGLANEQGAIDAGCVPDRLPGHRPVTDAEARARVESVWRADLPATPGWTATELLGAFGDGVRGALVVGENPAVSKRERRWVRARLSALDVLVVVDVARNETTRHADVVLPAAAGVETAGTITNLERRIQRLRPTNAPPGRARPDVRILRDLGARVTDRPDEFEYDDVSAVFAELCRVAPTHAGLSYGAIGVDGVQWPREDDGVLYRERFATDDGRARFGTAQPIVGPDAGDGLRLVTGGRTTETTAGGDESDRTLRIDPTDAAARGIDDDATVVVSSGETVVRTTADLDDDVRRGTVYLPASVADSLVRRGVSTVTVEPLPESRRTGSD